MQIIRTLYPLIGTLDVRDLYDVQISKILLTIFGQVLEKIIRTDSLNRRSAMRASIMHVYRRIRRVLILIR